MTESEIQSLILLEASKQGHRLWRSNAGKIKSAHTGTWVKLLPAGFADTFGFRKSDGKFIAIEVKNEKGKMSKEQKQFANMIKNYPVIYGVARSVEDAMHIIENGENGYGVTEY